MRFEGYSELWSFTWSHDLGEVWGLQWAVEFYLITWLGWGLRVTVSCGVLHDHITGVCHSLYLLCFGLCFATFWRLPCICLVWLLCVCVLWSELEHFPLSLVDTFRLIPGLRGFQLDLISLLVCYFHSRFTLICIIINSPGLCRS